MIVGIVVAFCLLLLCIGGIFIAIFIIRKRRNSVGQEKEGSGYQNFAVVTKPNQYQNGTTPEENKNNKNNYQNFNASLNSSENTNNKNNYQNVEIKEEGRNNLEKKETENNNNNDHTYASTSSVLATSQKQKPTNDKTEYANSPTTLTNAKPEKQQYANASDIQARNPEKQQYTNVQL